MIIDVMFQVLRVRVALRNPDRAEGGENKMLLVLWLVCA